MLGALAGVLRRLEGPPLHPREGHRLARAVRRRLVRGVRLAEEAAARELFVEQLRDALLRPTPRQAVDHAAIKESAAEHGEVLFEQGLTMGQVVHDYGHICQAVTGLAVELKASISADDFQTLNLCLDDAIAGAVVAYGRQRERAITDEGTERLGILAHEMRNLLNTALMSFVSIKAGVVVPSGSTSAIHERSLLGLMTLIDRSLADVRLDAGMQNLERIPVWEVFGEVEIGAAMVARQRGLRFAVVPVDHGVVVEADRQILCAAVANLVQNALKFTRRGSNVILRATTTTGRVRIDVEDECGGLPPGQAEELLQPFVQQGRDRTGLGLGLSICVKAVKGIGGELQIRNLPGKGCIFTIDLPTNAGNLRRWPARPAAVLTTIGDRLGRDDHPTSPGCTRRPFVSVSISFSPGAIASRLREPVEQELRSRRR